MSVPTSEKLKVKKSIEKLPVLAQAQIREEIEEDPRFKYFVGLLLQKDNPFAEMLISQRKAMLNEINPANYPETAGLWKKMRKLVKKPSNIPVRLGEDPVSPTYGESKLKDAPASVKDKFQEEYNQSIEEADRQIANRPKDKITERLFKWLPVVFLVWGVITFVQDAYGSKKNRR